MQQKIHIKKGDSVKILSGEDRGSQGRVLVVFPKKNRAIVEGMNIVKKHTKPNAQHPQGGIIEMEASIHISNLMIIDGAGNPTRIGRMVDEKTGKLVRFSKKSKDKKEVIK